MVTERRMEAGKERKKRERTVGVNHLIFSPSLFAYVVVCTIHRGEQ